MWPKVDGGGNAGQNAWIALLSGKKLFGVIFRNRHLKRLFCCMVLDGGFQKGV